MPKVSFVVMTYNQEEFVEDTLQSALEQDYDDMEFIFSDDASTDNTWERIVTFVNTHNFNNRPVRINKNTTTMGIMNHYNRLLYELTSSDIVIINEGDDVSLPQRTSRSVETIEQYGLMQVASNYGFVTKDGRFLNNVKTSLGGVKIYYHYGLRFRVPISGCTMVITRELINKFPPYSYCPWIDSVTVRRALLCGKSGIIDEQLLLYRIHDNNTSAKPMTAKKKLGFKKQYWYDYIYACKMRYITISERIYIGIGLIWEFVTVALNEFKLYRLLRDKIKH